MITIAKLKTLRDRTCVRKVACIFHEMAMEPSRYDQDYLDQLCAMIAAYPFVSILTSEQHLRALSLCSLLCDRNDLRFPIICEDLHYLLLQALGAEPSDWDFVDPDIGRLDGQRRTVLPHTLILDRVRSPFNVGSIFRTADSFGVDRILAVEGTADPLHPRAVRTARGCTDTVTWSMVGEEALLEYLRESGRPVFALELGGTLLKEFDFPKDGIAVLGSEEMGVSPALLQLCDQSAGRVSIPLCGSKGSLNVSVASGIMLHAWFTR